MNKLNAVIVIDKYFGKTGIGTHVRDLAASLARQNIQTTVFASDGNTATGDENPAFAQIIDIPCIPQPLALFVQLVLRHIKNPMSVVHVHDSIAFLGVFLFGKLFNVPTVFTLQASIFSKGRQIDYSALVTRLYRFTNRFVARHVDAMICPSKEMVECAKYAGAKDEKIVYQLNPIEVKAFHPGAEKRKERNEIKCLFVGQLRPNKGAEYLIRAVPGIVNSCAVARFIVVGDGPLKQDLSELCEKLGITEYVKFEGHVSYETLPDFYRNSDIFVCPSINEPMGLALMQALASGLPVVGSRVGGIPELVKDGYNGILVNPADSLALERAIIDLIKNDNLRYTYSDSAIETVKELSWDKNIMKFIRLYSGLAKDRKIKYEF